MKDFVTALGLVMILEGLPYFIAPLNMKEWIQKIAQLPDNILRQAGLAFMFLGLFLVYLVRG